MTNNTNELTTKSIILGIFLSVILSAANTYLGLFAGMTVSASIPAAILSMSILRFFKKSSMLENNLVQTSASAGESLAAGVIFTFPALVLIGYWTNFDYIEVTKIALIGGILGALFTIPLRRTLIVEKKLLFPKRDPPLEAGNFSENPSMKIKIHLLQFQNIKIFACGAHHPHIISRISCFSPVSPPCFACSWRPVVVFLAKFRKQMVQNMGFGEFFEMFFFLRLRINSQPKP